MTAGPDHALAPPGGLTPGQAAATAAAVAAVQRPDGAIPWFRGHHLDPWDHVEAAMALDAGGHHDRAALAYRWLADRQNPDGSWYAAYQDADTGPAEPSDLGKESHFCAYPAAGVLHHYLATRDDAFRRRMWPMVRAATEFVLAAQRPGGEIGWRTAAPDTGDGETGEDLALLTGCCSVYHSLRCALALADLAGEPQPGWELAAGRLAHALRHHPERFADKSRYAMDWYYPVLTGVVRGPAAAARLRERWHDFVVPGLGVRCVTTNPWVTGGESAELALALWAAGQPGQAARVLHWLGHLRTGEGLYWTGYVFADDAIWPEELTTWTAGAVLLASAALTGDHATRAVFGGTRLPRGLEAEADGCCART